MNQTYGNFEHFLPLREKLFIYRRKIVDGNSPHDVLVILNFSTNDDDDDEQSVDLTELDIARGQVLFGTHKSEGSEVVSGKLRLQPSEGLVLELD